MKAITTILPRIVLSLGVVLSLGGCATSGDPADPFEGFNRGVYKFNQGADEYVINPIARGYNTATPELLDQGVTNFFSNLGEISSFANNLLQLKIDEALSTATRFIFNSTFGIGGLVDVGSHVGLPEYQEDFGQTLGYWGVGPGPYLVLPLLGPSTVRDTGGMAVDTLANPITYIDDNAWRFGLVGLAYIDLKSDMLSTGDLIAEAALDEYDFIKSAYLERRRAQIEDDIGDSGMFGGSHDSGFEEFDD